MGDLVYFNKGKGKRVIGEKTMDGVENKEKIDPIKEVGKLREKHKLDHLSVDVYELAKKEGFKVIETNYLFENTSGVIKIKDNSKNIYVKKSMKQGKKNFVIAHELGHYSMEYNGNSEFNSAYRKINNIVPSIGHNKGNEEKANQFAAELLMPKSAFIQIFNILKDDVIKDYQLIYLLSRKFKTTEKSVIKRLKELNLEV